MNETVNLDDLYKITQQTAFNVAGISEQMGILTTDVRNLKKELVEMKQQTEDRFTEHEVRMASYEDRIRLTRPQANNVRQSIHARVRELLGIEYENGIVKENCLFADKYLRPGFISRCYTDARRESKLGTPYSETYQRDYSEVLHFIATWEPPTGTEGYTAYLLNRKKS